MFVLQLKMYNGQEETLEGGGGEYIQKPPCKSIHCIHVVYLRGGVRMYIDSFSS